MIVLLTQMLLALLCAAVAGAAIGWLACRAKAAPATEELRATVARQQAQVEQARTDVALISQDFDELKHRSRAQIEELANENRRLPSLHQNLEKSQSLVRQLMQKHEAQLRDLAGERDTLRARVLTLDTREEELRQVTAELERARRRLVTIDVASSAQGAANTDVLDDGAARAPQVLQPETDAAPDAERAGSASWTPTSPISARLRPGSANGPAIGTANEPANEPADPPPAAPNGENVDAGAALLSSMGMPFEVGPVTPSDEPAGFMPDDVIELDELDVEPEPDPRADARPGSGAGEPYETLPARADWTLTTRAAAASADADDGSQQPLFEPVDRHDDLKQIFGIGPMTETALNQLGITSYSQLADLKSHDIESIADALQIFPSRIERDDWVGNARRQLEDVLEEL